ncbi:hypothetical protein [Dysgonomonas gadei]|uniref:Uncharacterized protein n=1 Tax=Dysgonomonas gadei ATCC BAA-286 TaxID=742766 RepID=F5J1A4_9BACT|nr:hypothetical protein [Dysgonomonas gadei]EGK00478.1 hypothetical protein HMPREF9455_03121 [Dysgonomonas gadei ATCC BAA-286]
MKGIKVIWTAEMLEILRREFPSSFNRDLAAKLEVSMRTLIRKARELNLEKEEFFLESRRAEITEMARKAHPPQSTKGLKGWSVPGGEKFRFKKGHIPAMKTNPDVAAKVRDKRNATIRLEKLRLKYGLRTMTKLNIKNYW